MKEFPLAICALFLTGVIAAAQSREQVEMEWMTSPEIYAAMHDRGKTTAIVFAGGTEQRGPHGVLGGHTFMARGISVEIARKLGNALVAPIQPFAPTSLVGPNIPGGVALSPELFQRVNEAVAESLIKGGFRNVIFMGDHGSGQEEVAKMAQTLDAKYAPQGIRVIFCGDVYEKAREVFDNYAKSTMKEGFAYGTHAGLYDTSLMLYLQPKPEAYVRNNYKTVAPHPGPEPRPRSERIPRPADNTASTPSQSDRNAPRGDDGAADNAVDNGVSGDPRFATRALGRKMMEIKVQLAVEEIRKKLAANTPVPR